MFSLIVCYPNISKDHFSQIQEIRKSHDRHFSVINPHFTLVFPQTKLNEPKLLEHCELYVSGQQKIEFILDKMAIVEDDSKSFYHVFLVPSKGYDEIFQLHDRLYEGDLATELRVDIPFIPHLGIGTGTKNDMEELVESLSGRISIGGVIKDLDVISYDGKTVKDHSAFTLKK